MKSKKNKKVDLLKNYNYDEILKKSAFTQIKDLIGFKSAIKLFSRLPKDEVEFALDTDGISRIIYTEDYEKLRMKHVHKQIKTLENNMLDLHKILSDLMNSIENTNENTKTKESDNKKESDANE